MSPRLPRVTAREMVKVLERNGFTLSRTSGRHHIFKNASGSRVTVPVHAGKILHPKIVQNIIRDMDITVEQFVDCL